VTIGARGHEPPERLLNRKKVRALDPLVAWREE
jgi:hypothetical protein